MFVIEHILNGFHELKLHNPAFYYQILLKEKEGDLIGSF